MNKQRKKVPHLDFHENRLEEKKWKRVLSYL